jgi:hypothetical protein
MTVFRMKLSVSDAVAGSPDGRLVHVEIEAPDWETAQARLAQSTLRVNEDGTTSIDPSATGGDVYRQWRIEHAVESKSGVTTEQAARQIAELREKVQSGPDHGVTREQAAAVMDGMTADQIKDVAARTGHPISYLQRNKKEMVESVVGMQVGSALTDRAIRGYPEQGKAPGWVSPEAQERAARMHAAGQDVGGTVGSGKNPVQDGVAAARWTDPTNGAVHTGKVVARTADTADIEWDSGRLEEGVKLTDPGVTWLRPGEDGAPAEAPPVTGRNAASGWERDGEPLPADEARTLDNATHVTRWNADASRMEYGVISDRTDRHATVEWSTGDREEVQIGDDSMTFLTDQDRRRETEMRIRDAYAERDGSAPYEGGPGVPVRDLRAAMPDVSDEEFDAALERVARHPDVYTDPIRTGLPLTPPDGEEEHPAEVVKTSYGTAVRTVRMDDRGRSQVSHLMEGVDRDAADSYLSTLNNRERDRLAEDLGLEQYADETPEHLHERMVEEIARRRRERNLHVDQEEKDLSTLYDAENAQKQGHPPEDWTEDERKQVAAARARVAASCTWSPGRKRAELFEDVPADGSLTDEMKARKKDRDEQREVRQEARNTGQAYVDHAADGEEPCSAGNRHAGPCPVGNPDAEHKCSICGTDHQVDPATDVCTRCTRERANYNDQPDSAIPSWLSQRCPRCREPMEIEKGTQHFDADGGASVSTRCPRCKISSGVNWIWSTGTSPAEDENLCEECGRNPGHSKFCPLAGQPRGVIRATRADDGVEIRMVRDEHGYAVQDDVCGHVTSCMPEDRDDFDVDFEGHVGWHNAEHARDANRGRGDTGSHIERTATADDGVTIELVREARENQPELVGGVRQEAWTGELYVVRDEQCGEVGTGALSDYGRMERVFENHVALHNLWHKEGNPDKPKPPGPFNGTKEGLEVRYDDVVRVHGEMAEGLNGQIEARDKVHAEIEEAAVAVDEMQAGTPTMRAAARALIDAMTEAKLDATSVAGVHEAVDVLDAESVQELFDAVDIVQDHMVENRQKVATALEAVQASQRYVEATYGALAQGVQETGVSGKALEAAAA